VTKPVVCILAGGLGTRLGSVAADIPKPLVTVAGAPFLVHQLRHLESHGFRRVVLCIGHLGELIEEAIGSDCEGVAVRYSYDGPGLDGTLGAIRRAEPLLGERFLVMYGDTYLRLDFSDFYSSWITSGLTAGMTVLRNQGRWDRSNVRFRNGLVELYDKARPTADMEWIDYGLGALTAEAVNMAPRAMRDLSNFYHDISVAHGLFGYEVSQRFYEIGSPDALKETEDFLLGQFSPESERSVSTQE
jgi:N-acetyl-alpha-D-muramate 1-phosphate uridylyltransferase